MSMVVAMPDKRKGYTQFSVQVPNELVERINAKRGTLSINSAICAAIAKAYGGEFKPPQRGRPKEVKPAKKQRAE